MKSRASRITLLVLIVLSGLAVFLYFSKKRFSTVDEGPRNFSFKDTAAITRIFIADKDNHKASVVRTEKGWVVNEKYPCRRDAILNLLEVIKLVDVKMPVPKAARENVIKFMSFNAVKVEIYTGDEKVRQYYVGHESPDSEGSYMLLTNVDTDRNHEEPFVCFIPGFKGYLQPRFIANENEWRDRLVVNYTPPEVAKIQVNHVGQPADSSFTIELPTINTFHVKDFKGNAVAYKDESLRQYLIYFQNLSYEGLITNKDLQLQDSLSHQKPFAEITVTKRDGKEDQFVFYRKPFVGEQPKDHGVHFDYDPDRFYLRFANGREWAIAQYFVFGKLLVTPAYFQTPESVKK